MTNEEWIRSLSRKELAHELIRLTQQPDYGDDDDEWDLPFFRDVYICSDDTEFYEDYDGALEHECWWLAQNRNEKAKGEL